MKLLLLFLAWSFLFYLFIQVAYLFIFSLAATIARRKRFRQALRPKRIRILIPGYKEDAVIVSTARAALQQDYPKEYFEVVVIADSFAAQTLAALRSLPVQVVEVSFEKSTKGKALQAAINATRHSPVDIVIVLDADNHMSQGFLQAVNNAFAQGYQAVQGHRTAKSRQTAFAFLDACTEEINNHIFRRGHVALGLPSALIGSGMAFDWNLFTTMLQNIGETAGEDKEMEFRLTAQGKKIAFLDGVYVLDEKVAKSDVFSKQRSRWLAMQIEYFEKYFWEGWRQLFRGNIAFFNKVVQTCLLPRVMLVAVLCAWTVVCLFALPGLIAPSLCLLTALAVSLLLGIPSSWYRKDLFFALLQIPVALVGIFRSTLHIRRARKQFIHTPHGESGV